MQCACTLRTSTYTYTWSCVHMYRDSSCVTQRAMEVDVEAVLASKKVQTRTTEVAKDVELHYDLGNMLATDLNALDTQALRVRKEEYLKELARDNTQLLLNKIWELPIEKRDGLVLAELPPPAAILPREKPVPKPKDLTTWERFAKAKGIKNRKKSRMVFDETTQEYKPRWGYKRLGDPKDKWVIEIPERSDPYQDYFEKQAEETKEKVAKNEYQRLRNISRTNKGRVRVPLPPPLTKDLSKHQLVQALGKAKIATASVGKFTKALPKEPVPKRIKKSKVAPVVGDMAAERRKNLDILATLAKKRTVLNTKKAANQHLAMEEKSSKREKRKSAGQSGPKTKRSKVVSKNKSKTKGKKFGKNK